MKLDGAAYRYPSGTSVGPIDLVLRPGEVVLLTGPSGGGKSTVLRVAAGLAGRHGQGEVTGSVTIDGVSVAARSPAERARCVALVTQDPADQLVAASLADELAFGPEGVGFVPEQTMARVHAGAVALGMPLHQDPRALSAGQRQKVVVAACLAAGAQVLLLDEPLGHLDAGAAEGLLRKLRRLADEEGVAVCIAEHRVDACWPHVDRVVVLRDGAVAWQGARDEASVEAMVGLQQPAALGEVPALEAPVPPEGEPVLRTGPLHCSRGGRPVLHGVELTLRRGERLAIVGPNGAGKSTLLSMLDGLAVPDDPDLSLFCATVAEELAVGPRERGLPEPDPSVVRALGLEALLEQPPQALSRGQRLRVAVGAALCCRPDVLLLDEPTSGQDAGHVEALFDVLEDLGVALVFVTHDLELAARRAHRVMVLDEGRVVAEGPPLQALAAAPLWRSPRVATWLEAVPLSEGPAAAASEVPTEVRGLDPRLKLCLLGAVGVLAIVLDAPSTLGLLTAVTGVAALSVVGGYRGAMLGVAATVVWSTMLSQALFYADRPRVPLLMLGPVALWREGALHGLVQSLRMVSMGFAGAAVAVSTGPDRLLQGMVALRVPWAVAFLAVTSLRLVPEVAREWLIVRKARKRGRPPTQPWARLKDELLLLRPVIARSVRRARVLAEALDARGFDPVAERRPRRALRFSAGERGVLGVVLAGVLAVVGAEVLYQLYISELWVVSGLRPLYAWVR